MGTANDTPGLTSTQILRALRACIEGRNPASERRTLREFVGDARTAPRLAKRLLAATARNDIERLVELLSDERDGVRHLAAFALGYSEHERAVRPLLGLLLHQRDLFDHEYTYDAFRQLGRTATRVLRKIALSGSKQELYHAVQGLGHMGKVALEALRAIAKARRIPQSFYVAYFNLHDPRGLPDLLPGLESGNPRTRQDALLAASRLWEAARRVPRSLRGIDRERWGRALARLAFVGGRANTWALSCLGWLEDESRLPLLFEAVRRRDISASRTAVEALGAYRCDAAKKELARLLNDRRLVVACQAAVGLSRRRDLTRGEGRRVEEMILRGVFELEESPYELDAGFTAMYATRALLARPRGSERFQKAVANAKGPARRRGRARLSFAQKQREWHRRGAAR